MFKKIMDWLYADKIRCKKIMADIKLADATIKSLVEDYRKDMTWLTRDFRELQDKYEALAVAYNALLADHENKCIEHNKILSLVAELLNSVHPTLRKEIEAQYEIQKRNTV